VTKKVAQQRKKQFAWLTMVKMGNGLVEQEMNAQRRKNVVKDININSEKFEELLILGSFFFFDKLD
jgi:hypothetical protein